MENSKIQGSKVRLTQRAYDKEKLMNVGRNVQLTKMLKISCRV